MKKIISMVMAAAMVLSLVPATAFAAPTVGNVTATAKVIDAFKGSPTKVEDITGTELQLTISSAAYTTEATDQDKGYMEFEVVLDNAEFPATVASTWASLSTVTGPDLETERVDDNTLLIKATGNFTKDQVIKIPLNSEMTRTTAGRTATVSVYSDAVTAEDLVYATSVATGITASTRKTVTVAEEEVATLHSSGIVIEPTIAGSYTTASTFELKLSKGFEFASEDVTIGGDSETGSISDDGRTLTIEPATDKEFTVKGIKIEATTAKVGDTATITITAKEAKTTLGTASVEVATVVDYTVNLSVDEDEDVPVIYSGTNVANDGLTDDSDHKSLEVTIEETFPGAWSARQGFELTLPEGVYVTYVKIVDDQGYETTDWEDLFKTAYKKGEYKGFEFAKRAFTEVDPDATNAKVGSLTFQLTLVADPTFEGDVTLGFEGGLVDTQEVTIAKFVKPYTATAEQNDVIIDYRNTAIETPITVVEAEEGLWAKELKFTLTVDKGTVIEFEDDATFSVDSKSGMELKSKTTGGTDDAAGTLSYTVKSESDDGAATVTISDIELFMQRNIPAGAYDLTVTTSAETAFLEQDIYAGTTEKPDVADHKVKYSQVVNEAFVNVVTAGRDQDGVFTTKIVVPVGEMYIIAGGKTVELDVPAFISASGHTMLPLRAVANALGVDTSSVIWHAASSTVTILYGSKIVTITIGDAYVYVNGAQIPASTPAVIVDGRTFLTLRDLATALGVTDIAWDATTRTATLNGGN